MCKLDPNDKVAIENQYLREQLKLKEKELAVKERELQKEQLRGEFLKKHIPFDKKLCQREKIKILNSKYIKLKAFEYIEEYKIVYSIKFMCDFLPVTRKSYYKWIRDNKVRKARVNYMDDEKIIMAIKKFYEEFQIIVGSKHIKLYVEEQLNFRVGIHKIRKLNTVVIGNIKWKTSKNTSRNAKTDRHENYIRPTILKTIIQLQINIKN